MTYGKPKFYCVKSGEWVQPILRGYSMVCCDCGLVHTINFRIKDGRIQLQGFRDEEATRYLRRRAKIRVRVKSHAAKNAFKNPQRKDKTP